MPFVLLHSKTRPSKLNCSGDFSHVPRLHLPNNEMKAKDFPESCPLDVEPKYSAYSSWKSIYAKKPILQSGIVRVIGDGKDTNLWQSAWLNGYPLHGEYSLEKRCRSWIVSLGTGGAGILY